MSKTSLRRMFDKPALHVFQPDDFWPAPAQFIGVEIELEGQSPKEIRVHNENGQPYWAQHQDGSLRGGIEFVLNQPMMGTTLKEAVHYWFRTFKTYNDSPRTSIHVHINMLQDEESMEGLRNMLVLYYMFEDVFFSIADENRKWNGYCNPFEDDPPEILQAFMRSDDPRDIARYWAREERGGDRYYGLNLLALGRFGTLEFRHLPLLREEERLFDWIKMIMELKLAANKMADDNDTPLTVFKTPDDLAKLTQYMPRFGEVLLRYIEPNAAFIRMCNVDSLRLPKVTEDSYHMKDNKAWALFVTAQAEAGRKAGEKKPRKVSSKKVPEPVQGPAGMEPLLGIRAERLMGGLNFDETPLRTARTPQVAPDGVRRPPGIMDRVWNDYVRMVEERAGLIRPARDPARFEAIVDDAQLRAWVDEQPNNQF
jgi:hypothetical protein